jgi:hypothetical protein
MTQNLQQAAAQAQAGGSAEPVNSAPASDDIIDVTPE